MSNVRNITKSVGNIFNAATSTVSVSTEVLADTTGVLSHGIAATPAVMKALLQTPFAAAKGYLMEAEGMDAEAAEAVAYHYINQPVADTISQGGESAGKLLASMMAEDDDKAS